MAKPVEVNGPANILILLDTAAATGRQPDLAEIRRQAELTIIYMTRKFARGEDIYWHEVVRGEKRGEASTRKGGD